MKAQDIKPILCVVTSAKFNGDSNVPTGYWMSELFHPIDEFRKACNCLSNRVNRRRHSAARPRQYGFKSTP